jgi:hypothetical protein
MVTAAALAAAMLQLAAGACRQQQHDTPPAAAVTTGSAGSAGGANAAAATEAPATPEGGAATSTAVTPPPVHGAARGEAASAHLRVSGAYTLDREARGVCAVYPNGDLQVSFQAPPGPQVVLRLPGFHGAGAYSAEARIRANYTGESSRQSRGPAQAQVSVEEAALPQAGSLISGSFQGTYGGEAGTGEVAGSFARCLQPAITGDRG